MAKKTTRQLVRLRVAARAGNAGTIPRGALCEVRRWHRDDSAELVEVESDIRVGRVLRHFFALVASADEAQCRICGCTESEACPGGCGWEHDDGVPTEWVCSACCNEMGEPRDQASSASAPPRLGG